MLNDDQVNYLTSLNSEEQTLFLKEIRNWLIGGTYDKAPLKFVIRKNGRPAYSEKTVERETVNQMWSFLRELRDGQSTGMAWLKAHGGVEI